MKKKCNTKEKVVSQIEQEHKMFTKEIKRLKTALKNMRADRDYWKKLYEYNNEEIKKH